MAVPPGFEQEDLMRLLFIGLLCAGLALGCGGGNKPAGSTDSAANAGTQDSNQSTDKPVKDKKPLLKPPDPPKVNLP
jgi:hypothetical protein